MSKVAIIAAAVFGALIAAWVALIISEQSKGPRQGEFSYVPSEEDSAEAKMTLEEALFEGEKEVEESGYLYDYPEDSQEEVPLTWLMGLKVPGDENKIRGKVPRVESNAVLKPLPRDGFQRKNRRMYPNSSVVFYYYTTMFTNLVQDSVTKCDNGLTVYETSFSDALYRADAVLFQMRDIKFWVHPRERDKTDGLMRAIHKRRLAAQGLREDYSEYVNLFKDKYTRDPEQIWVVQTMESYHYEKNTNSVPPKDIMALFNISTTMARMHADNGWIPMMPKDPAALMRPPVPTAQKEKVPVMWMSKNCETWSERERIVEKLMEYIDIDSYSTCLHTKDWDEQRFGKLGDKYDDPAIYNAISRYKFYLSFENSECEDYVTEKYWRALEAGAVPIVLGTGNITDFEVAPHSMIKLTDFASIKDLAMYIKMLDQNDDLYEEYLWYKNKRLPDGTIEEKDPYEILNPKLLSMFDYRRGRCGIAERVIELQEMYRRDGKTVSATYPDTCSFQPTWKTVTLLE